jgi:hypothetical protein
MAITHEDLQVIKKELDDRYVLQSSCNEIQDRNNSKFANDDKRIDLILAEQKAMRSETKSKLNFNNWLTIAVLGCIIVGIVGFLYSNFGG